MLLPPLSLIVTGRTTIQDCYMIRSKTECCSSYDGREKYASVCVLGSFGKNICEPEKWVFDNNKQGLMVSCSSQDPSALNWAAPLHFALLVPMTGSWMMGPRIAGAGALAVKTVNADQTLLPVLGYSMADSGCSAKQGLSVLGKLLADENIRIDAVIGPGCSSACEVTSHLLGAQGIPQLSWGCKNASAFRYTCTL